MRFQTGIMARFGGNASGAAEKRFQTGILARFGVDHGHGNTEKTNFDSRKKVVIHMTTISF